MAELVLGDIMSKKSRLFEIFVFVPLLAGFAEILLVKVSSNDKSWSMLFIWVVFVGLSVFTGKGCMLFPKKRNKLWSRKLLYSNCIYFKLSKFKRSSIAELLGGCSNFGATLASILWVTKSPNSSFSFDHFFRLTNLIKKLSFFAIYLCVIGLRTFCFIRNRWIFLKACINIWQFYRLLFSCWSRFCFTFEGGLKIVNKNLFIRIR